MTPIISLIAAIDENRGLGKNNQLLCHLPADLKHFKMITMGKPIVMGRKTFESIGKALPGRLNIVLSRKRTSIDGVAVVSSMTEALHLANKSPEIMVIGGAELFKQALPYATRIYLTLIHHQFEADIYFPHINKDEWVCQESNYHPSDEKNAYAITFNYFEKNV